MFKFIKGFSDEWIAIPFDSPGPTLLGFVLIGWLASKFIELCGLAIILPIAVAFLAPFFLTRLFEKLYISRMWLCILHGVSVQKLIGMVTGNAINGNPQGLGLINIVFLFILLLIACGFLIFLAGDGGFLIFFVIVVTNGLYYLSTAIYEIKFVPSLLGYSAIAQIIIAAVAQIILVRERLRYKRK